MKNFTTEQLYEQAKQVLRRMTEDAGISDEQGRWFVLACHECGLPFPTQIEVGMIGQHAETAHGIDTDSEKVVLDLIWIGEGPPPGRS
jgi:hypothetical protein